MSVRNGRCDECMPPACTCGLSACATRAARGLVPFCRLENPKPEPLPANVFNTYQGASEYLGAMPATTRRDYTIRSIRRSGGPKRFAVVLK